MDEFDELDAAMAEARALRARHRAEESQQRTTQADFRQRFRSWAETIAAPTLQEVAEHVSTLHEDCTVHVHHPDHRAGGRESVDLNVRMMGEYVQLTFRPLSPASEVGIAENHGPESTESLEALSAANIRHRAITLVTAAITKAGQVE